MTDWYYNDGSLPRTFNSLDQFPEGVLGFIYCITHTPTGKCYIGKKILYNQRKTKISQREKKNTGTRKKFKQVIKESDWKTYWGSSDALKEDISKYGHKQFKREILEFCYCKISMSYLEVKWMFYKNVLEIDSYNSNILGRFYRNKINCN